MSEHPAENLNALEKTPLYTIGYSGFSTAEELADFLHGQGIDVLIDVRSVPYSAHRPQFDREALRMALEGKHLYYRHYAREFGARQEDRAYYRNGRLDFPTFTRSEPFLDGARKVERSLAQGWRLVLMCAEKDPLTCHRAVMISRAFQERGQPVVHLYSDGAQESHTALEARLIDLYYPQKDQCSLFAEDMTDDETKLQEAYRLQNDKIGFPERDLP